MWKIDTVIDKKKNQLKKKPMVATRGNTAIGWDHEDHIAFLWSKCKNIVVH